ncbi:PhzF family phenazine biosynthesis protein [Roseovarius sp. 2305UL8-3]|uniref:PhzF family phenazine biosynthesis protein n=1 Tax=Roseovarius conchicola TaxID=3121636 RepID=UPI0035279494
MDIQRLAAFTKDGQGGNPAGVVIGDQMPDAEQMQRVAAEVGYSETAFAARQGEAFRVRYFAPQAEVPFCGHATIALGAALGAAFGAGSYPLVLNEAEISVRAFQEGDAWGAELTSPPTSHQALTPDVLTRALEVFGIAQSGLDKDVGPARINGGASHLLIPVATHKLLQDMSYDFDTGAAFMQDEQLVTVNLIWRESPARIYSRNPFAGHGVYEDPATGAAAAALAGYLRDAGIQDTPFEVIQGVEMGRPSRLGITPRDGQGAPIEIAGLTAPVG